MTLEKAFEVLKALKKTFLNYFTTYFAHAKILCMIFYSVNFYFL